LRHALNSSKVILMRPIALAFLLLCRWPYPAPADEQQVFYGKTVDGWIAVLRAKTSTDDDRRQAMVALGYFAAEAKAAIPDLRALIQQGQLKNEASDSLSRIDRRVEERLPRLIDNFVNEGCDHLTKAGAIGSSPSARDALVKIGDPAVPALTRILDGPDADMRVCAAEALGRIGAVARDAVPSLIRAIAQREAARDPESDPLTRHAVTALGRIGPDAKAALPILNHLFDKKIGDDYDMVIALNGIGAPPVRKLVHRLIQDADSTAASLLARLGPEARDAIPSLTDAIHDMRLQVRFSAAIAIVHIKPRATEAVPVLIEALAYLDDRDLDVFDVPGALAQLGPSASAAIPTLMRLVEKNCDQPLVQKALVQIDPEAKQCLPALILALNHKDHEIVATAANCLGLLGPRAKDCAPALAKTISKEFEKDDGIDWLDNPQVSAVKAIGRIGASGRGDGISALIAALQGDHSTAEAAATVLGSVGPEAKAAVPALIEAVQAKEKDDENWFVRKAAALALARIGPEARPAVPVLRKLMEEQPNGAEGMPEVVIALYKLAPDGLQIAEKWLDRPFRARTGERIYRRLEDRALVLAAMGRTGLEGDIVTRHRLEVFNSMLAFSDPRDEQVDSLEEWFETFARLGVGARLAVPRLNEFRKHPDPWVRMWAAEALEKIERPAQPQDR
jgi:HEAT repeat protein